MEVNRRLDTGVGEAAWQLLSRMLPLLLICWQSSGCNQRFPIGDFNQDGTIPDRSATQYSEVLDQCGLHRLWNADTEAGYFCIRVLSIPARTNAVVVSLERAGRVYRISTWVLDGTDDAHVGRVVMRRAKACSVESGKKAWDDWFEAAFRCSPTTVPPRYWDDHTWVVEGIADGKYHIYERNALEKGSGAERSDPIVRLCYTLLTQAEVYPFAR